MLHDPEALRIFKLIPVNSYTKYITHSFSSAWLYFSFGSWNILVQIQSPTKKHNAPHTIKHNALLPSWRPVFYRHRLLRRGASVRILLVVILEQATVAAARILEEEEKGIQ